MKGDKEPRLGNFTNKERDNIYTQLNTMIDMMDG